MITSKKGNKIFHVPGFKKQAGYSLLEVLVVLIIFALLATISSTAMLLAIRGARKSDASSRVRASVDFAIATIERQLRNASSITSCDPDVIVFNDQDSSPTSFSCIDIGESTGYVASASARLTASEITVTNCQFTCTDAQGSNPPSVSVELEAKDKNTTGAESASFSVSTQVVLRTY